MSRNDTTENTFFLEGILLYETEKAFLIAASTKKDDNKEWFPKSQVEVLNFFLGEAGEGSKIEIEVPEWLINTKDTVSINHITGTATILSNPSAVPDDKDNDVQF